MKVNWSDPRFKGLSKKQIKEISKAESLGKVVKIPKPKPSKRVNKKIKKQDFISKIKSKTNQNGDLEELMTTSPNDTNSERRKKVLEAMKTAPIIVIDSSFESIHNKKVQ